MVNIVLLVECSQSIIPYKKLYLDTINKFIQVLNNIQRDITLSIATYNTKPTFYCLNQPVCDVKKLTESDFIPEGNCKYYDSICSVSNKLEKLYKINNQEKPLVIILANNDDNNSHTRDRLVALQIAMQKATGWGFIFSGVTDNSIYMAQRLNYQLIYKFQNDKDSLNGFIDNTKTILEESLLNKNMEKLDIDEKENN